MSGGLIVILDGGGVFGIECCGYGCSYCSLLFRGSCMRSRQCSGRRMLGLSGRLDMQCVLSQFI